MQRDWHLVDHYAVLGVSADATQDEITGAFHRLARAAHPDAHPDDPEAEECFKAVSAAYEVLGDPTTRAEYDRVRRIVAKGRTGRRVWLRPAWFPDPWMIAVVGLLLVGTALVVDWQDGRVPDGWVETSALVTRELPPPDPCFRNCDTDYWIEAPAANGKGGHLYDGPAEVGERLPFAYDPEGSRWKVLNEGRYVPWTMGLPGAVLLFAAGLLAVFSIKRGRMQPRQPRITRP